MGAACARRRPDASQKLSSNPAAGAGARSPGEAGAGAAEGRPVDAGLRQRRGGAPEQYSHAAPSTSSASDGRSSDRPLDGSGATSRPPATTGLPSTAFAECIHEARAVEKRRLETVRDADEALKRLVGPEATLTKLTSVDGRLVVVVDGAVPPELLEHFYGCLQGDAFRRTEFARPDTRKFRHHITEYDPDALRHTRLSSIARAVARACFEQSGSELEMFRVYTNAVLYGDVAFVHRDSHDHEHVTVLLYPNPEWASELDGETMFYDEHGEIVEAVQPRPGRLCAFHGSIQHKGSPPSRLFFGSRYTTAFKFSPREHSDSLGNDPTRKPSRDGAQLGRDTGVESW